MLFSQERKWTIIPSYWVGTVTCLKTRDPNHKNRTSFNSSPLCDEELKCQWVDVNLNFSFFLIVMLLPHNLELADAPKSSQCGFLLKTVVCGFIYLFYFYAMGLLNSYCWEGLRREQTTLNSSFNSQRKKSRYLKQIKQKSTQTSNWNWEMKPCCHLFLILSGWWTFKSSLRNSPEKDRMKES